MPLAISSLVDAGIRAETTPAEAETTSTLPSTASSFAPMRKPCTEAEVPAPVMARVPWAASLAVVNR